MAIGTTDPSVGPAPADAVGGGPVVVGVDRSGTAAVAAERAAELARERGARLHLVMAVDAAVSYEIVVGSDLFRVDNRADGEHFLRNLGRRFDGVEVTIEVCAGSPSAALAAAAERIGASMIVVGDREVPGAGRSLGSLAIDLRRRSRCEVVVVDTTCR